MVGSSVANNWSRATTPAPVSALNRVDLPALVYPTRAITGNGTRLRATQCSPRVRTHLLEVPFQTHDALADLTPVRLDLGFARAAQEAEATALAFQMGPGPNQT